MIVSIPLLGASCITQQLPNSRCQEYQIVFDIEIISIILVVGYLCEELNVVACPGEQNVEVARDCERLMKH
jgi:hypothetical protein